MLPRLYNTKLSTLLQEGNGRNMEIISMIFFHSNEFNAEICLNERICGLNIFIATLTYNRLNKFRDIFINGGER